MLKSYFLITLRNLWKRKVFTVINVMGLAIGIAGFLLILQYVFYEYSYDTFHAKADQIYRVRYDVWQNGKKTIECAAAVPAVGPAMKDNFPEVKEYARLFPISGVMTYVRPDGFSIALREEKMQIATPSVFSMFSFKLLKGNPETALEGSDKVVLSERAAKKYFGEEDPIGKILDLGGLSDNEINLSVSGVMENVPENSHIKFDFLISYQALNDRTDNAAETAWGWYDFNTYVELEEGVDPFAFQEKWDAWLENEKKEEWEKRNSKSRFELQPLTSIHLYSNLLQESEPQEQGDGDIVKFLMIIAGFILLIAWVNYVNLSTSRAAERANEVGVRKAMGAYRGQLVKQFMFESVLLNLLATFIALALVSLLLPYFQELTQKPLSFAVFSQTWFWVALPTLFLIGAVLSGWYPSLVLSSYKPVAVLKGKFSSSKGGVLLRQGLVIFQFAATIVLVAGTVTVYRQLDFMMDQDLGFDMNKTLVVKAPEVVDSTYVSQFKTFKNELLRSNAQIKSVTASSNVPGDEIYWTNGIKRLHGGPESHIVMYNVGMDYDYVPSFQLEMVAGRNYSLDYPSDSSAIILNEAAIEILEFESAEEAIGEYLVNGGDTLQLVGVLENYHQMSLKNTQAPILFKLRPDARSFYSIKLENGEFSNVMEDVQSQWNAFFSGNPFDYFYLDEFFNKQYENDQQFGSVFGIFAGLAIFIACLGLFGLSAYTAIQRTKEIGIRKVLGSSAGGIFMLLSRDFIRLILIANLLAWAPAWFVLERWLESFPFHIQTGWAVFVFAGLFILCIALLTVSFQTVKAATSDPIHALRDE
ncbi:FtsX-like permease family protein [Flammeovirgaceae bacterium SG7u.111]|nr:FtsX-like permease family protein [Flammeovirgaceae bacterium SG7u.132]WPO34701.1 FtsX-like permease family protein [Flammeovirgaceae bacterium SG7u.111]